MQVQKFWGGGTPPQIFGAKNMHNFGRFFSLFEYNNIDLYNDAHNRRTAERMTSYR